MNAPAGRLADFLRARVDESGKTLAVLAEEIPFSKTQISSHLGGQVPSEKFVTALIRATVQPSLRDRRRGEAALLLYEAEHPPRRSGAGPGQAQSISTTDLLAAQSHQLETYERLTRALEQAAELREAAENSARLILVLLGMIHQLNQRVAAVGDIRDVRPGGAADRQASEDMRRRLARAEAQRGRARDELIRTEEKKQQAEDLVRQLEQRIEVLTDELDRLRGAGPSPHDDDLPLPTRDSGTGPDRSTDAEADDIDAALDRVSAVNDIDADTIGRISGEVAATGRDPHAVVVPDNAFTSTDLPDGLVGHALPSTGDLRRAPSGTDAEFEHRYRAFLVRRYGELTIHGVDLVQRRHGSWSLDQAYMSLEAATDGGPGEPVEQALAGHRRSLVTGGAGSGKTTLLQWLAVNSARGSLPSPLRHLNDHVPFVLPLRQLARGRGFPAPHEFLMAVGCTLADQVPDGWAVRVFEQGRVLVLVDGIDEISVAHRVRARRWLDRMLEICPQGSFVVTMRPRAMPQGWLGDVGFRHLTLRPMSSDDVATGIARWHTAARAAADERERRSLYGLEEALQGIVRDDSNLAALAASPLLLSLLCALHRDRNGVLPRSVMHLYAAGTVMLLERRDAERDIGTAYGSLRPTAEEGRLLLQTLAYWMIREERSEIDRDVAVRLLRPVLPTLPRFHGSSVHDAAQALAYLCERSGILNEPGVDQLEFTHSVWQDYLGSREAVEAQDFDFLVAKAHEGRWENVVRMAAGHARPRECGELLSSLIARGDREQAHRERLYRLADSCLEYANALSSDIQDLVRDRSGRHRP
ncbi:NACHT domain-containing protein [Streptomyces sp. NPDC055107]